MKVTIIPKIARQVALPLVAATSITATAIANPNPAVSTNKHGIINIDTFERADQNKDNVLSYDEFSSIKMLESKKIALNKTTEQEKKNNNIYGMICLAIILAAVGIISDIQNNDNRKNERDSLF